MQIQSAIRKTGYTGYTASSLQKPQQDYMVHGI